MNKELLRDAVSIIETCWARSPQDMTPDDKAVLAQIAVLMKGAK